MILDLENRLPQDRYVPDVMGYNFSVLMPDPFSSKGLRKSPAVTGGVGRLSRLGAVLTYCEESPPDAATQKIIADRGDSIALIRCGYSTGGAAETGYRTATPEEVAAQNPDYYAYTQPAPVYQPPTNIEDCAALGLATAAGQACVQRNTQRAIDAENAFLKANRDYQTNLCIANDGGGWVPAGTDVTSWCAGQYGGTPSAPAQYQASTATNRPNQSVPPSTPITTIPTLPASTPTRQVLTSAYTSGSVNPARDATAAEWIAGLDSKTKLLLGAAGLLALFMVVKK